MRGLLLFDSRMFIMLLVGLRQTDEDGREECEDVSLDEADQRIEQEHEDRESDREHYRSACGSDAEGCEDEDKECQSDNDHVTTHHIGEKTHAEGSRLGEHTEHLDELHDGEGTLQPDRHIRPEDILPIMLAAEHVGNDEGAERQDESYSDITGKVCTAGEDHDKTYEVHHQDKEEGGEQVGGELGSLLAESSLDGIVIDKIEDHFEEALGAGRCFQAIFAIIATHAEHDEHYQESSDEKSCHILGDREIKGTILAIILTIYKDESIDRSLGRVVIAGSREFSHLSINLSLLLGGKGENLHQLILMSGRLITDDKL